MHLIPQKITIYSLVLQQYFTLMQTKQLFKSLYRSLTTTLVNVTHIKHAHHE